jgi:hypothetical protein
MGIAGLTLFSEERRVYYRPRHQRDGRLSAHRRGLRNSSTIVLFPLQIKNLAIFIACLNLIASAGLDTRGSAVALGLVLVVFAIPVLVLIGLYAVVPQRASTLLGSLRAWTEKNNRAITVVLCFVFGAFFSSEASGERENNHQRPWRLSYERVHEQPSRRQDRIFLILGVSIARFSGDISSYTGSLWGLSSGRGC